MSDVFSRLADRALERTPRARPRITPRYASPAGPLPVEEVEVEAEARPTTPLRGLEGPGVPVAPRPEAPREANVSPAPRRDAPPDETQAGLGRTVIVEREAPSRAQGPSSAAERSVERVLASVLERTHFVEAPAVAAPPVPLRPADAAALRPPESRHAPADPPRLASIAGSTEVRVEPQQGAAESIQVTIGRIDVRATRTAAPVAPPQRPRPAPMGLDEYLRRRNEDR